MCFGSWCGNKLISLLNFDQYGRTLFSSVILSAISMKYSFDFDSGSNDVIYDYKLLLRLGLLGHFQDIQSF